MAIKCLKNFYYDLEQVNSLREVQALKILKGHKNIIKLIEVIFDEVTGKTSLVLELFDMNLYEAIKDRKTYFNEPLIQWYTYQLLKSMNETHKNGIFHRDLKPENILLKDEYLVLADMGTCKGINAKQPFTEYISTRWYRAPECIMTNGYYNYKMDIWGVGCILFEMATFFPLFPGKSEFDQMLKIQNILGPPTEDVINLYKENSMNKKSLSSLDNNIKGKGFENYLTHCNPFFIDLLKKLLVYNPEERFSAQQALKHKYFYDITENQYYIKYLVNNEKNNLLTKNNENEHFSKTKTVDDSKQKFKNFNKNYNTKSENIKKLNNKNINTIRSTSNIMNNRNNNNLNNNNYNKKNSIIKEQNSQINIKEVNKIEINNNPFKKENIYKIKVPKTLNTKLSYTNNSNNINIINAMANNKSNIRNNRGNKFVIIKNINKSTDQNSNISNIKRESMSKKMNILKSKYVSPYSRKSIFTTNQKNGKQ